MAKRLGERPLARDRLVDGAEWHRARTLDGGSPRGLELGPRCREDLRRLRGLLLAPWEAFVELGLDVRSDVHAVDGDRFTEPQPRRVDLHPPDVAPAYHDARQVRLDELGTAQVGVDEYCAREVLAPGECGHVELLPEPADMVERIGFKSCPRYDMKPQVRAWFLGSHGPGSCV